MKFILIALASLFATPGTGQYPLVQNDFACNQLDTFMLKASNNTCSIKLQSKVKDCTPLFEKTAAITPNFYSELEQLTNACKEEMMQTKTEEALQFYNNEYKKVGCDRKNLNAKETGHCKKINDNVNKLNKILENNHQR